jgi:NAD(P)-dependent dehydrogenase (short-subunit alcohol dehydrogenase family)
MVDRGHRPTDGATQRGRREPDRRCRRVVVTGGAQGIGRAIVSRFLADGATVCVVDRIAGQAWPAEQPHFLACDLADPVALARAARAILDQGPVDVLVHNAAVSLGGSVLDTDPAAWQQTLAVNLTAPFLLTQAVAGAWVAGDRKGTVVLVSSINGFMAERDALSYVATKHGLVGMTRSMAVDLAPYGVRVNAVAPGPVRVDRNAAIFDDPAYAADIQQGVPLGRAGRSEEVAQVVFALAEDSFSFVTGTVVAVDGGFGAYARLG